jgi:cytochrome c556
MKTRILAPIVVVLAGCGSPPSQPAEAPPTPAPAPIATEEAPAETPDATPAETPTEPSPDTKAEPPPPGSPTEKLMRSHFKETELIRNAVITGDMSAAIAPAKALANIEGFEKLAKNWQPSVKALQAASARVGNSPDIPAIAAATADIGVACGTCHRSTTGPKVQIGTPPAAGATMKSRMQRHIWAAERMWEGLYVPSDAAWKAGTDAMVGEPFPKEIIKKGGVHARSAAETLKRLIGSAGTKKTPQDRAKAYASMLETCSACHQATK